MLFNTFNFVFLFLPLSFLCSRIFRSSRSENFYISLLIIVSFYFYSYFITSYIFILMFSIFLNYFFGNLLLQIIGHKLRKSLFLFMISINLILLIYFKYFNFLVENLNILFAEDIFNNKSIILPLAISFFTFQQIIFLTNIYNREIKKFKFLKYVLFISFFPQLIAGPIIKFKEFYPQISKSIKISLTQPFLTFGLLIFSIGMFKKIIISNYLAKIADPVFNNIENGVIVNTIEAWLALLAFSLQIYFDFSGYTDMAIGLALCFGITLPINFNSPYKSKSIKEFWNNWHITLSRFLREHIYIPLGGNKKGNYQQFKNIFITMTIGGIWHGASWNFILWGTYHGFLIILEKIVGKLSFLKTNDLLSKYLVFLLVTLGWVPFRCQTIEATKLFFSNIFFLQYSQNVIDKYEIIIKSIFIFVVFIIVMYFPNSNEIQKKIRKNFDKNKKIMLLYLIIAFSLIFFLLAEPDQYINREFIYFQF